MLLVVLEPSLGPGVVSFGIQTSLWSLQFSGKGKFRSFLFFLWLWFSFGKKKDTRHLFIFIHIQANVYRWNYIHYIYTGS